MSKKRVAINGFGRMGRLALRTGWDFEELEFAHINEIAGDASCSAHLLNFDSVHGRWHHDATTEDNVIMINNKHVTHSSIEDPAKVDWSSFDIVIEASGKFRSKESLQTYFDQGVKKVVVAAPVGEPALNIVMGINDDLYETDKHHLVTAASCTTNCLAPVVKVMNESLGIKHGCMTTIHDITNTQTIVDKGHKDLRRARACGQSLIPTSTGSAAAITKIFPELEGKLNGLAVRVPLLNASLTDFVFESERPTTAEEVNELFKHASEGYLNGILGYEERPLVSIDYKDDPRSSIIDAQSTMVIDQTQVKVLAWYDNEFGYATRLAELVLKVAKSL